MPLTLSNRETFAVLDWLERDPERRLRLRAAADRLAPKGVDLALPRLTSLLCDELDLELPHLEGVAAELLKSGANRVNFFELALALLTDAKPLDVAVVTEER